MFLFGSQTNGPLFAALAGLGAERERQHKPGAGHRDGWIQVFFSPGMIKLAVRALRKIKGLVSEGTIITVASF